MPAHALLTDFVEILWGHTLCRREDWHSRADSAVHKNVVVMRFMVHKSVIDSCFMVLKSV